MNDFSVLVIAICLGVLSLAGIKAIWLTIVGSVEERKMKKFLDDNPEYFLKLTQIKHEIIDKMAE